MQGLNTPSSGSSEASSFLRCPEELRRFLDDIIRAATAAKSLLESCRGPLEACNSRAQPPPTSDSRSPCRLYSFCFFCGETGHIRANCDSCKEYLAAGKCLIVKGRVVLPTGQEIPREVPGRTLKDRLDSWDLGHRSMDIQIRPSSPDWLISLEDVGSQMPQTHMISLAEGPSRRSAPVQPQVPTRTPTVSSSSGDGLLCRPHSPSHVLPTGYSRGRPHSHSHSRGRSRSRSRDRGLPYLPSRSYFESSPSHGRPHSPPRSYFESSFNDGHRHQSRSRSRDRGRPSSPSRSYVENSPSHGRGRLHSPSRSYFESPPSRSYRHQYTYSSRSRSRDSHDSRDYYPRCSPPPVLSLAYSHLSARLRDEPTQVRQFDGVVTASSYSNQSPRSSWEPAHSGRRYSRSRTPQPSRRVY